MLTSETASLLDAYADHKKNLTHEFYDFLYAHTVCTLFWKKWTLLHEKYLKELANNDTTNDPSPMASLFLKKREGLLTTMEQILRSTTHFAAQKDTVLRTFGVLIASHDKAVSSLLQTLHHTLKLELTERHQARKATKSYEQTQYYVQGGPT